MAGGHGHGTFPPTPGRLHTFVGKALGATMWLWILYRAKEDGPALLVCTRRGRARAKPTPRTPNGSLRARPAARPAAQGFRHPWEHAHGHGSADAGHAANGHH